MALNYERINAYRIMWLFVFFDLPVGLKKQRKAAARFRKDLEADGLTMLQFSVYIRHCGSRESLDAHRRRVKHMLPEEGHVFMLAVTDKQFGLSDNFYQVPLNAKKYVAEKKTPPRPLQLEIF